MVDSVSVFFSYSHKDEELRNALDVHLAPLRRDRLIAAWHDRKISVGTEWDAAIQSQLRAADIIVLLLSPDYLASDYCAVHEIPAALARHAAGEAVVIPVVLRTFTWSASPVAHLQSLPRDKKAINGWADRDEAYVIVAEGIREEAMRVLELRRQQALQRDAARERYQTKVLEMLSDGRISPVERDTLDELRDDLKLTPAEARAIEAKAAEPLTKYSEDLERYKRTLLKVIDEEYPIGEQLREDLKLRRRDLGLKDEDADRVEAPILAEAEARHQRAREAVAAAPVVPPAPPAPPAPPVPAAPPMAAAPPVPQVPPAAAALPEPPPAPAPLPPADLDDIFGILDAPVPAPAPVAAEQEDLLADVDVVEVVATVLAECGHGGDLHVAPKIPAAKLDRARRSCNVPSDEPVLGLLDLTVFGSASDALLIGPIGIDYHHDHGDTKDFHLQWSDMVLMAQCGEVFTVKDKTQVVAPNGTVLYVPCSVATSDLATLLTSILQRLVDAADAAASVPEAPPATQSVHAGPVIVAPAGAQAQEQAVWSHLLADMKADLNDSISRLLYDRSVGSELRVFALAGDARADLLCAFVGDSGDLLVAVWGNKELPQVLSLAHPARKRLTDELGFQVLTGQGLAFARGFGPAGEADVDEVVALLADLIFSVFDLPRGGLAVSWELPAV